MSTDTLLNLGAYVVQIAAVTAVAELLLRAVPVAAAGFRYVYWRLVLAGALVAPWVLRKTSSPLPESLAEPLAAAAPAIGVLDLPLASPEWAAGAPLWPAMLPWVFAAGAVARILWVAAGLIRLRTLRRTGTLLADPAYQEIQDRLGTSAELRAVPGLAQPVTFGVRRPVVLLPEDLAPSADLRRAVVTHELFHVQRRDWLWVIAEEGLRAALWFHPAIWWLTFRIQLAREEFTDHLTVLATGSRRAYMEALVAFSEGGRLDPAPAFARRGHLFHRIVMLSKEAAMSSRRIVFSGAVVSALLVASGWYAGETFPLVTAPVLRAATPADRQLPAAAPEQINTVTPENPIPRRLFSTPIPYPAELAGSWYGAALELTVVLNAGGSVASATRNAVSTTNSDPNRRIGAPDPDELRRAVDAFVAAAGSAIRQWQYDPPAKAPLQFFVQVRFGPGQEATISQSDISRGITSVLRTATPAFVTASGAQPVRVGGNIRAPKQTRKVNPVYPEIARSARVQGVVILEALIDEQGTVAEVRVLRSIPLLDQAALDAVRQWEYTPTQLNGAPVPVIMTTTVQFTLPEVQP